MFELEVMVDPEKYEAIRAALAASYPNPADPGASKIGIRTFGPANYPERTG
jgi:hypothetical protein